MGAPLSEDKKAIDQQPITFSSPKVLVGLIIAVVVFAVQFGLVQYQLVELKQNQADIESRQTKILDEQQRHFTAVDQQLGQRITALESAVQNMSSDISAIRTLSQLTYDLLKQHNSGSP